jgi:hypothetical protein
MPPAGARTKQLFQMRFLLNHLECGPYLYLNSVLILHGGISPKMVTIHQNKAWFSCSILCRKDHKLRCRLLRKQEKNLNYCEKKKTNSTAKRIDGVTKSNVFNFERPKRN